MRLLYLAGVIPLTILSAPSDEFVRMALQPASIIVTPLDGPVQMPGAARRKGPETPVDTASPALREGPVMPDIPLRLHAAVPDMQPAAIAPVPVFGSIRTERASVTATSLNIRSGPSPSYPVVAGLSQGDRPFLTGQRDRNWVQIRLRDVDARGWVHGAFLSF